MQSDHYVHKRRYRDQSFPEILLCWSANQLKIVNFILDYFIASHTIYSSNYQNYLIGVVVTSGWLITISESDSSLFPAHSWVIL